MARMMSSIAVLAFCASGALADDASLNRFIFPAGGFCTGSHVRTCQEGRDKCDSRKPDDKMHRISCCYDWMTCMRIAGCKTPNVNTYCYNRN